MTDRQTMIIWTAKQIRESGRTDIDNAAEELFSEMSGKGHKWAEKIRKYNWTRFVGDVKKRLS